MPRDASNKAPRLQDCVVRRRLCRCDPVIYCRSATRPMPPLSARLGIIFLPEETQHELFIPAQLPRPHRGRAARLGRHDHGLRLHGARRRVRGSLRAKERAHHHRRGAGADGRAQEGAHSEDLRAGIRASPLAGSAWPSAERCRRRRHVCAIRASAARLPIPIFDAHPGHAGGGCRAAATRDQNRIDDRLL